MTYFSFVMSLLLGGLLAINVYMGVTTGNALSWAACAFIAVMIGQTWVSELRRP